LLVMGAWSLGFCVLLVGTGLWLLVRGHVAGHEAVGLFIVFAGIAGPGLLGMVRIRLWLRPNECRPKLKHRRFRILVVAMLMIVYGVVALGEGIWLFAHDQAFAGAGLVAVGMAGSVVLGVRLRYAIRATRSNLPQEYP
jgi:hypothetical protein